MTARLVVDGKSHEGWESIRITRGIERGAGDFSMTVSERWPGQYDAVTIKEGQSCEVYDDADILITGYVDNVSGDADANSKTLGFSGRSKAADTVDCSIVHKSGQWIGRTVTQIASEIVAPFGIKVRALADVGAPFPDFQIQQGETVFATIEKLCRMRGLLASDDERGNITLIRSGADRASTSLYARVGDDKTNILRRSYEFNGRDRFSDYIVKGQAVGTDDFSGANVAAPTATTKDPAVKRYRPTIIIAEQAAVTGSMSDRGEWERATRAGRSIRANFQVQGWRQGDGALWKPNQRVPVDDEISGITGEMLISEVTFSLSESGTLTDLVCYPPEAFLIDETPPKKKGGSTKSKFILQDE
ncbi:MAG: contractile injection system protein, VgrG/Pvc8 family [Parvibaculum sp.]|nr:contractile injection system protein, VgrG/Pvc8 family [Parvibaculum sp.]